jgi:ABC-type hemin transport system substrate-binding protein
MQVHTPSRTYASRIVCLTEETTETLYLLGEDWRIVGISGFTVRPPRARKGKPRVSAFTSAKIERIVELAPESGAGILRPAGRYCGRADPARHRGSRLQSAQRREICA